MTKSLAMEMVNALEEVANQLGRTPTRDEFQRHTKHSRTQIDTVFGSYVELLLATGRHSKNNKKKRVDKQEVREKIFEKLKSDVEKNRALLTPPPIARNLIILPDLHCPWMHPQANDFISAVVKKYGYDVAACTGDEIDGSSWSFHDPDPDSLSPGHELEAAIKQLQNIYKLFPKMMLAESNHGSLFMRKAKHHGIPTNVIKPYGEVISAPKEWTWHFEIKIQLSNGKMLLIHHSYSANALRASQQRGINYIAGHHHSQFSLQYWKNYDDLFFAGFAGCLVDEMSLAMLYGKNIMNRPILGLIRVEDAIPQLVPMILDKGNIWNGKI